MIKKLIVKCFLFFAVAGNTYSQDDEQKKRLPSVYIGAGVMSFNGDVGKGLDISSLTRIRSGFTIGAEQRIGKFTGVSLDGIFGKVANSDHSATSNLNFESPIRQGNLSLVFHFDNGLIFKNSSVVGPYIQAGISFIKFDAHSDLKDKNGVAYNYWSDGTIRSIPEMSPPVKTTPIIQRDYSYETQLTDPNENYKRTALGLPLCVGFKLNATDLLSFNIAGVYNLTFTDRIDNVKDGKSDRYFFGFVSMELKFYKKDKDKSEHGSVDFASLDKADLDEDGVADKDDDCPGTLKGTTVDSHGCPVDTDGDGIPDFKDKELNSVKGATVDAFGVTITDQNIAKKSGTDSLATDRSQLFKQNPSLAYLNGVENKIKEERKSNPGKTTIPESLKIADKNKDGLITTNEITDAIDSFFDGKTALSIDKLNSLIDYFFEQ